MGLREDGGEGLGSSKLYNILGEAKKQCPSAPLTGNLVTRDM